MFETRNLNGLEIRESRFENPDSFGKPRPFVYLSKKGFCINNSKTTAHINTVKTLFFQDFCQIQSTKNFNEKLVQRKFHERQ
jgi:hypothetical protein